MKIAKKIALVTGANRGLGRALVHRLLECGASAVYAAARDPRTLEGLGDERVVPLRIDVTDLAQIRAAAKKVGAVDLLINNAGVMNLDDIVKSDQDVLRQHLDVNLYGTLTMTQAYLPQLRRARGAIVNMLSLSAFAPVPGMSGYSISKAATLSVTQSLRLALAVEGIRVHAVLAGPVDTEMIRALSVPKAPPADVAAAILDGLEADEDEIFPDPWASSLKDVWAAGPAKVLERQVASMSV